MRLYLFGLATCVVVCVGCSVKGTPGAATSEYVAPPASMLQHPGPMIDGPGPGVLPPMAGPIQQTAGHCPANCPPGYGGGAAMGGYGLGGGGSAAPGGLPGAPATTQVTFVNPPGMTIGWQSGAVYAEDQLVAPAKYNFPQAAVYRLKLSDIPGRPGLNLYPTLQLFPAQPETAAYLSHVPVPVEVTAEDLDNVRSNNFVTKVVYLPDAEYQDLAIVGVETLVSTRLDPGQDPVALAEQRGTLLAVFRMGGIDLEMPGRPLPGSGVSPVSYEGEGGVEQVDYSYQGELGEFAPPIPIATTGTGPIGVPAPQIVAETGVGYPGPGMAATLPVHGIPNVGTPIGLPGPPHLPYGGPASLQSHTMRNLTKTRLPRPVEHSLTDVKHNPGLSLPAPVAYTYYEENHPHYGAGEVKYPGQMVAPGTPMPPGPHGNGFNVGPYSAGGAGFPGGGSMVDPGCPNGACPVGQCRCK
ncbi:hypothetical protein [Alienimonas chondri]|uniref:Uncharacterized protein n=1 Tax=Alienimonas chondri TaxID=2681879 RepID=A0ABX1VCS6_9PLAN|nr:hypothetical protein [Alienimonas chondri]NNJ25902.1 hypothetical protein [Alienimonas chondri]